MRKKRQEREKEKRKRKCKNDRDLKAAENANTDVVNIFYGACKYFSLFLSRCQDVGKHKDGKDASEKRQMRIFFVVDAHSLCT